MPRVEQGSDEWLKLRAGKINASTCAVWELKSPWGKPKDQVRTECRALAGAKSEFVETSAVRGGKKKEPFGVALFEKEKGLTVDLAGSVEHPEYTFLRASPDGLIGFDACLEVKCPSNGKTYSYKEKPVYEWQMRLQMEVLDVDLCYFVCYVSDDVFKIEEVKRTKGWLEEKVSGQLLPNPDNRMIRRVDLYHAWFNFIQSEYQDPARLQKHLDAKDMCHRVDGDPELDELTQKVRRKVALESLIYELAAEQCDGLEVIEKEISELKKKLKKRYNQNVTNGLVEFLVTIKSREMDYKKAFEAMGGQKKLLELGFSLDSYLKQPVKQTKIRLGGNDAVYS